MFRSYSRFSLRSQLKIKSLCNKTLSHVHFSSISEIFWPFNDLWYFSAINTRSCFHQWDYSATIVNRVENGVGSTVAVTIALGGVRRLSFLRALSHLLNKFRPVMMLIRFQDDPGTENTPP